MKIRALPLVLGALYSLNGWAEDPVLETQNATVRGSVYVDAPADKVRALVGDPVEIARIDDRGATVDILNRASCTDLLTRSPTIVGPISYRSRVCPTATGWSNTLVSSEDFEQFHEVWSVASEGRGTRLSYELTVVPKGPVPVMIVIQGTKNAVKGLLNGVREFMERR